jgi:uncharacterized protein
MASPRLILFTRFPDPGRCKTRLIPSIGAQGAAQVHRQLTEATLNCLGDSAEVHFVGGELEAFAAWLGDGPRYIEQAEGDLGDRLLAALNPAPVIFFGSDTPDLTRNHVADAVKALARYDVVIGPAEDGGYYLIGLSGAYTALFEDMPWSTDRLCAETRAKCEALGLTVAMLETLSDCDTPEDLERWPHLQTLSRSSPLGPIG